MTKQINNPRKRKAISTVITTIILLVSSAVSGAGIVLYGSSLFQSGAQQENISVSGTQLWVNATDTNGITWGASGIRNSGEKIVSVDSINIRGTAVPITSWYADKDQSRADVTNLQSLFEHEGTTSTGFMRDTVDTPGGAVSASCDTTAFPDALTLEIDLDGAGTKPTLCLLQQSSPITMNPGDRMIVYYQIPSGKITPLDAGSSATVAIFAGKAGAPQSITIQNPP